MKALTPVKKTFLFLNLLLWLTGCAVTKSPKITDEVKTPEPQPTQVDTKRQPEPSTSRSKNVVMVGKPKHLPVDLFSPSDWDEGAPVAVESREDLAQPENDAGADNQREQIQATLEVSEHAQSLTTEAEQKVEPIPEDPITRSLLDRGQEALTRLRFLTPEDDNANLYFQAALGRDPGNYEATIGIGIIVEQYCQWAIEAARRGERQGILHYLEQARSVNPRDPLISQTQLRIETGAIWPPKPKRKPAVTSSSGDAEQKVALSILPLEKVELPENLFSLSEDEILARMQPIIDEVTRRKAKVDINWPNDAEARLIYQIINSRIPDYRVRAMIYHRALFSVEFK